MSSPENLTFPLKIFSTLAVRAPFDNGIIRDYSRNSELDFEWNPTTVIEKRLHEGQRADLVIATDEAISQLIAKGQTIAENCFSLVNAYLGVAVTKGVRHPDISTKESFLTSLKNARSVAYSLSGASGIYLQKLMADNGILSDIASRATKIPQGFTAEKLVTGEADLAIQQMSELMVVKNIDIIGPFPEELQQLTSFTVAVMNNCNSWTHAQSFIHYLLSEPCRRMYLDNGLQCR